MIRKLLFILLFLLPMQLKATNEVNPGQEINVNHVEIFTKNQNSIMMHGSMEVGGDKNAEIRLSNTKKNNFVTSISSIFFSSSLLFLIVIVDFLYPKLLVSGVNTLRTTR